MGRSCHEAPQRVGVPKKRGEGITSEGEGRDLLEVGRCRGRTVHDLALVDVFLCEIPDGRARPVPVLDDPWGAGDSASAPTVSLMLDGMSVAINRPFAPGGGGLYPSGASALPLPLSYRSPVLQEKGKSDTETDFNRIF